MTVAVLDACDLYPPSLRDLLMWLATIRIYSPEIFLCALYDEKPELFLRGLKAHRASLQNPTKDAESYIQTLRTNGLKWLALRLEAQPNGI